MDRIDERITQFSATRAKQSFGDLLAAAALAPVAIERHGRVQALVMAPQFFTPAPLKPDGLTERRIARLNQALTEKDRLIRHQRIAFDLVTLPAEARNRLIQQALDTVARWQSEQLCSLDYIERWSALLRLPAKELAAKMMTDDDGWGPALRQNSPWIGNHA